MEIAKNLTKSIIIYFEKISCSKPLNKVNQEH
jgi:hypothetical protein